MDVTRGVFVEWHGLKQNVSTSLFGLRDVNKLKQVVVLLENVWVALLADLALELLPIVRRYILAVLLYVPLLLQPVFKALKVDQSHGTPTLACQD